MFNLAIFCFMFSLMIGQRPDGSRVLLSRPHGTTQRVGTQAFRALFLSFGNSSRVRTVVYSFAGPVDWYHPQRTKSRLFVSACCSGLVPLCDKPQWHHQRSPHQNFFSLSRVIFRFRWTVIDAMRGQNGRQFHDGAGLCSQGSRRPAFREMSSMTA